MLRRSHILTTAALLALCALPATSAMARTDTGGQAPPSSIAASEGQGYQDLRMPDTRDAANSAEGTGPTQDLRSPDARDAAQHRGPYGDDTRPYVLDRGYGSPDAVDAGRDLPPVQIPAPVVEVRQAPGGGFDWGDAGIGAAGMLALFSIAAGSALLVAGRKRRRGLRMATH